MKKKNELAHVTQRARKRAAAHKHDPCEVGLQCETAYGEGNPARVDDFAKETSHFSRIATKS